MFTIIALALMAIVAGVATAWIIVIRRANDSADTRATRATAYARHLADMANAPSTRYTR